MLSLSELGSLMEVFLFLITHLLFLSLGEYLPVWVDFASPYSLLYFDKRWPPMSDVGHTPLQALQNGSGGGEVGSGRWH